MKIFRTFDAKIALLQVWCQQEFMSPFKVLLGGLRIKLMRQINRKSNVTLDIWGIHPDMAVPKMGKTRPNVILN